MGDKKKCPITQCENAHTVLRMLNAFFFIYTYILYINKVWISWILIDLFLLTKYKYYGKRINYVIM